MCLKTCCGIVPVKTGTLILLWKTVIFWTIVIISIIYDIIVDLFSSNPKQDSRPELNGQERDFDFQKINVKNPESSHRDIGDASVSFCLTGIILATAIFGLFAIEKKKSSILIPYFLYQILWAIIVTFIFTFLLYFEGFVTHKINAIPGSLGIFGEYIRDFSVTARNIMLLVMLIQILIIIFEIHCCYVIFKCYQEIGKEEELERRPIPMNASWSADKTNVQLV